MGCFSSKQTTSFSEKESVVKEAQHATGLSRKQRFLLKGSWKGVSRDLESTGVSWFLE